MVKEQSSHNHCDLTHKFWNSTFSICTHSHHYHKSFHSPTYLTAGPVSHKTISKVSSMLLLYSYTSCTYVCRYIPGVLQGWHKCHSCSVSGVSVAVSVVVYMWLFFPIQKNAYATVIGILCILPHMTLICYLVFIILLGKAVLQLIKKHNPMAHFTRMV